MIRLARDDRNLLYKIPDRHRLVAVPELRWPWELIDNLGLPPDWDGRLILGGTGDPIPAILPQRLVDWDLGPRSGVVIDASAAPYNGDFQAALSAASWGDIITIPPGVTYTAPSGNGFEPPNPAFTSTSPQKRVPVTATPQPSLTTAPTLKPQPTVTPFPLGEPSYILVKSASASLPPWDDNTRWGLANLANMATLKGAGGSVGPNVVFAGMHLDGGNVVRARHHVAFHGVRLQGKNWPYGFYESLMTLGHTTYLPAYASEVSHHFLLRRCLFDGAPDYPSASVTQSYARGIYPMGRELGVRDSAFLNIWPYQENQYCLSEMGGEGVHHLENNFVEGCNENFMWGGTDAPGFSDWRHSGLPSDVVVRRNRFRKQLWGKRFADAAGEVIYNTGTVSIDADGITVHGFGFLTGNPVFPVNDATFGPQYLRVESVGTYVQIDPAVVPTDTLLKLKTAYPGAPYTNVTYRITHYDGVARYAYNGNKNLLECKFIRRWDVRGNIFEWHWGGGQAMALVAKSQGQTPSGDSNAFLHATDVTIRYNRFRDCIAPIGTWWQSNSAQRAQRYSIYHNLMDHLGGTRWNGTYSTMMIDFLDYMDDLLVEHNTSANYEVGFYGSVIREDSLFAGGHRLAIRNNIWQHGDFYGGYQGGFREIESFTIGTAAIEKAWPAGEYIYTKNVHYRDAAAGQDASYPAGNAFLANESTIQFVDYAGRNYRLQAGSPYRNWGTDGQTPGVDMDLLEAETAGV